MKEIQRIHQRPQTRGVRLPPIGQGQRPPARAGGQRPQPGGQLQITGHAIPIQHRPPRVGQVLRLPAIGGQGQGQRPPARAGGPRPQAGGPRPQAGGSLPSTASTERNGGGR